MTSIHADLDNIEWTPGSAYKGPDALYQGQEVFYRKVLSDRRQEGGGLAVLSKICPPPGTMVKTVALLPSVAEHLSVEDLLTLIKSVRPLVRRTRRPFDAIQIDVN